MGDLPEATLLKETDSPSNSSYQLLIVHHLGVKLDEILLKTADTNGGGQGEGDASERS